MCRMFVCVACACVTLTNASAEAADSKPLVVHEWGTFTVLQDERGNPVDGVNINEETLPAFVHRLAADLTPDSHELAPLIGLGYGLPRRGSKGIQRFYHAARMRMETPIIYLYPPEGHPERPITVDIDFHGGWITEWYPDATIDAPGYRRNDARVMLNLKASTTGHVSWKDVTTTDSSGVPETDFPVWTAPRKTSAPALKTAHGESENYLFYRGVANLEAPLQVTTHSGTLTIHANANSTCPIEDFSQLEMWLVDVATDGEFNYRSVPVNNRSPEPGEQIGLTSATLEQSPDWNLHALRAEMRKSLVARGLFPDEAEAMLNTWEASYFRTEGLRLFFTLPQAWTDRVLPMDVQGYDSTQTVRTMIGRIELISETQRNLIRQIASGPVSDRSWFSDWLMKNHPDSRSDVVKLEQGLTTFAEIGLAPPGDYQAYMRLGRFRDALIRHEIEHQGIQHQLDSTNSPSTDFQPAAAQSHLRTFAANYGLPGR